MARILTLDDDKDCLAILRGFLMVMGHEAVPMLRAEQIMDAMKELKPDLVITDMMMPGVTGGTVYHLVRANFGPNLPVIISSGSKLKLKLPEDNLLEYCPKPVDMDELTASVTRLLARAESLRGGAR